MPAITPVPGKLINRLVKAMGITFPISRLVIECDVTSPAKVYIVGPVDMANYSKVCEEFELLNVAHVEVKPDASVEVVRYAEREG